MIVQQVQQLTNPYGKCLKRFPPELSKDEEEVTATGFIQQVQQLMNHSGKSPNRSPPQPEEEVTMAGFI